MLIIDGHNLAFADDDARQKLIRGDPGRARRRVMQLARLYGRSVNRNVTVVFDGTGGHGRSAEPAGRVRCCFSGADHSADAVILRLVAASTGRREICVVTGDRRLGAAARQLRAKTMGVKEFLKETARQARRQQAGRAPEPRAKLFGPPPSEVEYWLKEFSKAGRKKEPPSARRKRKK